MARSANNNGRVARSRSRPVEVTVSALRDVRRALTVKGDIASDVAFQNDVNALLANLSRLVTLEPAVADLLMPAPGEPSRGPRTTRRRAGSASRR